MSLKSLIASLKRPPESLRIDDRPGGDPGPLPEASLSQTDREALAQLADEFQRMRLEWAEVLDKVNRWAGRQAARQRKELLDNLDTASADDHEAPAVMNGRASKDDLRRQFAASRRR
jgi:hypothetical protein